MSKPRVLVVDDEKNILSSLSRALDLAGYEPVIAGSAELALERLAREPVDLVLLDVKLPGLSGLELLERLRREHAELPVVMMSGQATIQMAVDATRLGARDFVEKPFIPPGKLLVTIENALKLGSLERENRALKREVERKFELVGQSRAMRELKDRIAAAAPSHARVLITGEHGTGKELVARAVHALSLRARSPFIKVNCAAIPTELIESELFGHEKGSFTGAIQARRGKFELAHTGTLLLDEIGDMKLEMQAKLLRVLQENEFERVGSADTIAVDVRVLAATNKDLEREIASGRFREDLYYRLNVMPIRVPPLRERREDVALLARHFAAEVCADNGRRAKSIADDAVATLESHAWPGNVRELKNIVERLVILVEDEVIRADDVRAVLPEGHAAEPAAAPAATAAGSGTLRDLVAGAERRYLVQALDAHDWQIAATARTLGLERSHLYKKMRHFGIKREG